jgi:hypothetical protein
MDLDCKYRVTPVRVASATLRYFATSRIVRMSDPGFDIGEKRRCLDRSDDRLAPPPVQQQYSCVSTLSLFNKSKVRTPNQLLER